MLIKRQINQLNKAKKSGVGSDLKISQTQIRKVIGGNAPRMGTSGGGAPRMGLSINRSQCSKIKIKEIYIQSTHENKKRRWKNHE